MTAVDDELMRLSVCATVALSREKGVAGIGVPMNPYDESRRTSAVSAASLSVPPVLAARMGGREARRFLQGVPGTPTVRAAAPNWRWVRRLLQTELLGGPS